MNHGLLQYMESELRKSVALLMLEAPNAGERSAQIHRFNALATFSTVAVLLAELEELRGDALVIVKNLHQMAGSSDGDAWLEGQDTMWKETVPRWLEQTEARHKAMASIPLDETVVYSGEQRPLQANHVSINSVPLEPIPSGVRYDPAVCRFRESATGKDMGYDFYKRWQVRAGQFPGWQAEAVRNPAGEREIQPGMPGFNVGDKREGS